MNEAQAKAALELIQQSDSHDLDRRVDNAEAMLDMADRVVSNIAQLKLINEDDPILGLIEQLTGVASANPT